MKKALSALLVAILALGLMVAAPIMAQAATITVGTEDDLIKAIAGYYTSPTPPATPVWVPPTAVDGDTIQLSADITYTKALEISGKSITLDLDGFKLEATAGLYVQNGALLLADPDDGEFNVSGRFSVSQNAAVYVANGKAEVTNASTSAAGSAVYAGTGGEVKVYGDVEHTGASGIGVFVAGGAAVIDGNVSSAASYGVDVNRGTVAIEGNVAYSGASGDGVRVANGGAVTIGGNVEHTGAAGTGVRAIGGTVTIDGALTVDNGAYVRLYFSYIEKTQAQYEAVSSNPGYLEYKYQSAAFVWVKHTAHTFGTVWEKDAADHWHACTACGEKSDAEAHDFDEAWESDAASHWHPCTVCGEKGSLAPHAFGDWVLDLEAGTRTKACACGYETAPEKIPSGGTGVYRYDTTRYIRIWGKTTGYQFTFLNFLKLVFLFGWIWMAF